MTNHVIDLEAPDGAAYKPYAPVKTVIYLLVLELIYSGISIATTMSIALIFGTWSEMTMYAVRFPIMLLIYRHIQKNDYPNGPLKLRKHGVKKLMLGFFLLYVLPVNLIFKFLVGAAETYTSANTATIVINTLFIAPVLEEIVYRGIFYRIARRHAGFIPSVIATGIIFSFGHYNIPQMVMLLFANLAFCSVIEKTSNIKHTIAMHLTLNWLNWIGALILMPIFIAFPVFIAAQVILVKFCIDRDKIAQKLIA